MWTATLYQINKDDSRPTAVVLFTDNTKYKRLETIDLTGLTASSFRNIVEGMRARFESSFAFIDAIDMEFDLTPTVVTISPEEQALRALGNKKLELMSAKNDLEVGIIAQDAYDQKLAEYKALEAGK